MRTKVFLHDREHTETQLPSSRMEKAATVDLSSLQCDRYKVIEIDMNGPEAGTPPPGGGVRWPSP